VDFTCFSVLRTLLFMRFEDFVHRFFCLFSPLFLTENGRGERG
jgi:hypothetical protein